VIGALVLSLAVPAAAPSGLAVQDTGPSSVAVQGTAPGARAPVADVDATLAEWRELWLVDLGPELVRIGPDALREDPALAAEGEAVALVARALFDAGRDDEARALLDGAEPSAATAGWIELERARALIERDELKAGLKILQASPDAEYPVRFPDLPDSWLLAGRGLFRAGSSKLAAPLLEEFVERWPLHVEAPAAWYMLSQHAIQEQGLERAQACRERAAELSRWHGYFKARTIQRREAPEDPLPRLGLAQLWLQVGANDEARAVLEELVELAPEFAPGWAHLAEAERKLGDAERALAAYDRALELDGTDRFVRANRGLLHLALGDEDAAYADLDAVCDCERYPEVLEDARFGTAFLELARLALARGDRERAAHVYAHYEDDFGGTEPLEE